MIRSSEARAPCHRCRSRIERSGGKGKAVDIVIEYSGEDLETNLSLVEKMRRDFGLEIPVFDEEDTPE